jgi:hypothetical protein
MLANLGALPLDRIQTTLKMVASMGDYPCAAEAARRAASAPARPKSEAAVPLLLAHGGDAGEPAHPPMDARPPVSRTPLPPADGGGGEVAPTQPKGGETAAS